MDFVTILAIALGLSFDTFAVSLSYGVVRNEIVFRQASWVAIVLAIFQGGLTVLGYFLGSLVSKTITETNYWIALGLLVFLGVKMMIEGIRDNKEEERDYGSFLVLITIAVVTSIDAFAIGISFALLEVKIWGAGFLIGTVTFLASMIAIRIGKSAGEKLGSRVEIFGGLILIAIGVKIFLQHMYS
ncbi:MAG TPA: manganese efflux pump MntP family protein [Bacteroidales bacterium]|jgi:putative Mn2+ efflux pump MntP|nr:manganese efflux pump MntP family protein [Bacteroidales bacterium]